MANDYKIRLEVRGRTVDFGADSAVELLYVLSKELFRLDVLTAQANIPNNSNRAQDSIDTAAQRLIEQYRVRFDKTNNRSNTLIFRAGRDVDLARCYLARMKVEETVEWFKKEKNFKTSVSAVGRYWTQFAQLPPAVKIE